MKKCNVSLNKRHCEERDNFNDLDERHFEARSNLILNQCASHMKHLQYVRLVIFLILTAIPYSWVGAQNLEAIGKSNPLKINGGVTANEISYITSDTVNRRDPSSTVLTGNLNLNIYDLVIPLAFTWSDKQHSFQQPFNQYSMHPHYKWITGHFGYTSMSFSPYTLSGHLFLGGGVDIKPTPEFSSSIMYGRLKKPIEYDTANLKYQIPTYARFGFGLMTSYNHSFNENLLAGAKIIVFHAKDDKTSVLIPDSANVKPIENMVLSTALNVTLYSKIQTNVELSNSAITRDINLPSGTTAKTIYNKLGPIFEPNASTEIYNAYKININYTDSIYMIGVGYECIDPGYSSLGAYYFNNDLENITLNGAVNLLKNKVVVNGNIGKQRDNLDNKKMNNFTRWVSSLNLNFIPNDKLNTSLTYSSFQSFTYIKPMIEKFTQLSPYENLDTLNFTQISQSFGANMAYTLKSSEKSRQNINLNFNEQISSDRQSDKKAIAGAKFYTINIMYLYMHLPSVTSGNLSLNVNINDAPEFKNQLYGPSISITKPFFNKKLKGTISSSYNMSYINGEIDSKITNLRNSYSYTYAKAHNFNINLSLINRKRIGIKKASVTDFTAIMGYSYNF